MITKPLKLISTFVLVLLTQQAWADEAMMLEGNIGNSQSTMYSPQDAETKLSGNTSFLRLHFPMLQGASQFVSLTLSNQFFHGTSDVSDTGQRQILGQSALGVGLSYRLWFFILGAEYQQGTFDQITVGPQTTENIFYLGVPHYYGGLLYRFGHLGVGVIYSLKKFDIPAEKSQLTMARPYEEKSVLLALTYHFDGGFGSFMKSLFTGK